jgi:hypothetical protein
VYSALSIWHLKAQKKLDDARACSHLDVDIPSLTCLPAQVHLLRYLGREADVAIHLLVNEERLISYAPP